MKKTIAIILSAALTLTSAPVFAFDAGGTLVSEEAVTFGDGDLRPEPEEDIGGGQSLKTEEGVEAGAEFVSEPEETNEDQVLYETSGVMTDNSTLHPTPTPTETPTPIPTPTLIPTPTAMPWGTFTDEDTLFKYRFLNDGTAEVCGFEGVKSGDLIIPDEIAGYKVTGIGYSAFSGCREFVGNLTLPTGLQYIGDQAFYECDGLVGELHLPEGVTRIGSGAFYGCDGFSGQLLLPDGLSEIDSNAFFNCSGFTGELKIPSQITNINESTFSECSGFTSLVLPNGLLNIDSSAFYNCNFTGTLTLPESLTSIGSSAFSSNKFTGDLIIPESLSTIGNNAFLYSGFTGHLEIPETLLSIGYWAFANCGFTGDLVIPSNITFIRDNTFYECKNLNGSLILKEGVKRIGAETFHGCGFTGKLELPSSLVRIDARAFASCSGFTGDLVIPETVTVVKEGAFNNTNFIHIKNQSSITIKTPDSSYWYSLNNHSLISDGITSQDTAVRADNIIFNVENNTIVKKGDTLQLTAVIENLEDEDISFSWNVSNYWGDASSVASIDESGKLTALNTGEAIVTATAFDTISNRITISVWDTPQPTPQYPSTTPEPNEIITDKDTLFRYRILNDGTVEICGYEGEQSGSLTIPDTIDNLQVTGIGVSAFTDCRGFSGKLVIPESVTYIGNDAFANCDGFTGNLKLPDTLISIDSSAFIGCNGFTGTLAIPNNVTFIGDRAFSGCYGFTKLELPDKLMTMGSYVFSSCKFVGDLKIPEQMTNICPYTFNGCRFTGKLLLHDKVETIGEYAFGSCYFTGKLELPDGITAIKTHAFSDNSFSGTLDLPQNLSSIGEYAFSYCNFTGNLVIPGGLKVIEPFAFCDSGHFDDLIIQEGIERIPSNSFSNCIFRGKLELPSSLTRIGEYAFSNCGFSGKLSLPNSLTRIDTEAFSSNRFTGELVIPESVTTVVGEAFNYNDISRIVNKSSAEIVLPNGKFWYSSDTYVPVFNILTANSTVDTALIQITPNDDFLYYNPDNNQIQFEASIVNTKGNIITDKVNTENKKFTWSVRDYEPYTGYDTENASIDENGLLTIFEDGNFLVTATIFDSWTGYVSFITRATSEIIPTTTPTASPTVKPSTSPTVTPTATPSVTPSVRPSTTPDLSPTVTPTASPTVTPTAAPTGTPEATTTPTPSAAPEPTGEPEPTLTPDPTQAPEPTQAPTITPGPVSTPEGITVEPTLGSKKVDLSWNPVPDADGYIILVKDEKTGEFKRIKTINDPNVTSFSKTMGELGGLYTFKIQSFKKTENGPSVYEDLGGEIPVQLYEYNKAEKPEVKGTTKTGSKKVHFQWEKIDGADGYLIYKLNPTTKQFELLEKIEGEDSISYDLSEGLGNGETYSFRVRSYAVSNDGEQVNGKISATIKVTTPPVKAKKPAAVSKEKNKAQISWPTVNNAKGYRIYRSTSKNGKYSSVKTVKGGNNLSFTDKNLKSGKVYFYKIRAYSENPDGTKSFGAMSAAKKVKVK